VTIAIDTREDNFIVWNDKLWESMENIFFDVDSLL